MSYLSDRLGVNIDVAGEAKKKYDQVSEGVSDVLTDAAKWAGDRTGVRVGRIPIGVKTPSRGITASGPGGVQADPTGGEAPAPASNIPEIPLPIQTEPSTPAQIPGMGAGIPAIAEAPPAAPAPTPGMTSADEARRLRHADIRAGVGLGRELLPEGTLGRVNEQQTPEMIAARNATRSIFESGFGAPVFQAAREARLRGLNRGDQGQQRMLRQAQARGGIGGALGASQLANLQRQQGQARTQAEQDLLLQEAAIKQGALGDWANLAQQGETYNLKQGDREKILPILTGLAEGQSGLAERTGLTQSELGRILSQTMASQGGGGKK